MFKRLILEDSSVYYVVTAFLVAATIFMGITWRALGMPRSQRERFARLPLEKDENARRHES